ncbi:MAG: hypothetical protein ACE5HK_03965 [Candidatus Methylomirabilales bacterium]
MRLRGFESSSPHHRRYSEDGGLGRRVQEGDFVCLDRSSAGPVGGQARYRYLAERE